MHYLRKKNIKKRILKETDTGIYLKKANKNWKNMKKIQEKYFWKITTSIPEASAYFCYDKVDGKNYLENIIRTMCRRK